jgi:hypothetical protein
LGRVPRPSGPAQTPRTSWTRRSRSKSRRHARMHGGGETSTCTPRASENRTSANAPPTCVTERLEVSSRAFGGRLGVRRYTRRKRTRPNPNQPSSSTAYTPRYFQPGDLSPQLMVRKWSTGPFPYPILPLSTPQHGAHFLILYYPSRPPGCTSRYIAAKRQRGGPPTSHRGAAPSASGLRSATTNTCARTWCSEQ